MSVGALGLGIREHESMVHENVECRKSNRRSAKVAAVVLGRSQAGAVWRFAGAEASVVGSREGSTLMIESRRHFGLLVAALLALTLQPLLAGDQPVFSDDFEAGDSCRWGAGSAACPGFQIESPGVAIGLGEEITYCYYFRTPNAAAMGIRRWAMTLGPTVHDAALFATYDFAGDPADRQPPGTMASADCGLQAAGTRAKWVFGAHASGEELLMPTDDGTGSPLAMEVLADQPMFLRIHFINLTDTATVDGVTLMAEALPAATSYTPTASYMTYSTDISVGAGQTGSNTHTCGVPPAVNFWWLSTETHKFATQTKLQDGAVVLQTNTDWQAPAISTYPAPGFLDITAIGGLTYHCEYNNFSGHALQTGDGPENEICSAIGYFFPATQPYICFNNSTPI